MNLSEKPHTGDKIYTPVASTENVTFFLAWRDKSIIVKRNSAADLQNEKNVRVDEFNDVITGKTYELN